MQHFPSRLGKLFPSLKESKDDWVTQATQVIIRPQERAARQLKKTRHVGSDGEMDALEHTHRLVTRIQYLSVHPPHNFSISEILKCVEQLYDESMCTPTRTTKSTGRVFPCDDLPYACLPCSRVASQQLQQPLLSSSFFIVKFGYVCAVSDVLCSLV